MAFGVAGTGLRSTQANHGIEWRVTGVAGRGSGGKWQVAGGKWGKVTEGEEKLTLTAGAMDTREGRDGASGRWWRQGLQGRREKVASGEWR